MPRSSLRWHSLRSVSHLLAACGVQLASTACSPSHAKTAGLSGLPRAEFLLSSADSTFWISTAGGLVRVRGVPITLARYGGRWYELYTADDDFSYDDALLLGERVYRRDLVTGDSVMVFADTTVPRVAAAYARAHPDERPLEPDEDGEANPSTSATAEVDFLDVLGPYLSYEYHVDIALPGRPAWHSARRGVLDLRSGRESGVADLFGRRVAGQVTESARAAFQATRDSIARVRSELSADERRVADAIARRSFDDRSFSLAEVDGRPALSFAVPGRGEGAAGRLMQLDPVAAGSVLPPWWGDVRTGLPTTDDADDDRWEGAGYHVIARYDTSGETANISLADLANREWPVGTVTAPLQQITWLDRPAIGAADRRALTRAFDAAASYDEAIRVASARHSEERPDGEPLSSAFHLVNIHATDQDRPRKPARDLRAHDARACQQPRARVRGCDSLDHGQSRRDRRVSAQPRERRDRVHRPGGLSGADPRRGLGRHAGERQLRGSHVDGGRRSSRS